jgi:hypothetical protein
MKSSSAGAVVDLESATSTVTVSCDPGDVAIGGGISATDPMNDSVYRSGPDVADGVATGWVGGVYSGSPATNAPTVYVFCVPGSGV